MASKAIIDKADIIRIDKLLAILGGLLILVGFMLAWVTIDGEDNMGEDIDAWWTGIGFTGDGSGDADAPLSDVDIESPVPVIVVLVLGLLILLLGLVNSGFPALKDYYSYILAGLTVLTFLLMIFIYFDLNGDLDSARDDTAPTVDLGFGIGSYITLVGTLLAALGGVLFLLQDRGKLKLPKIG